MVNSVTSNPIVIDTFGSDVTISTTAVKVKSIVMEGASAGDTATFIVGNGGSREVLRLSNTVASASIPWAPSGGFTFQDGLIFDDSASDLASGDFIFIYLW